MTRPKMSDVVADLRKTAEFYDENLMPVVARNCFDWADEIEAIAMADCKRDGPVYAAHKFWRAGETDCPSDIKSANGELHTLRCKVCGENNNRQPCKALQHAAPIGVTHGFSAAYEGDREDLLDWKGRALDAEHKLRIALEAVNEMQGPTFMGEAALRRASIVTEHDVDRACDIYCDASPDAKEVCTHGMRVLLEYFVKKKNQSAPIAVTDGALSIIQMFLCESADFEDGSYSSATVHDLLGRLQAALAQPKGVQDGHMS